MYNFCDSKNITASITVTSAEDFSVGRKIIDVFDTDAVSYHNLSIVPSNKAVACQNYSS